MHDIVLSDTLPFRRVKAIQQKTTLALIGTFPPTRCGIATFTQDMVDAVRHADPHIDASVIAITPPFHDGAYGPDVIASIRQHHLPDYIRAAALLNERRVGTINLQHEFGIFGGVAGGHILHCLDQVDADVITTLHTVSAQLSADCRRVMSGILERSGKVVVMAEKGRSILVDEFGADPDRISVIPHGVPTRTFSDTATFKAKMGFDNRSTLMTFGLIGRGKGLETMIRAMPDIAARHPDALYVILGATHPNVVAAEGERYRESLGALAQSLGVEANILFIDKYASQHELIDYLSSADIYVTPYLNENQLTSGTLAYAYALGRPIVSTPYAHAAELLTEDRGVLCDFGDSACFAAAINDLLANPARRLTMGRAAHNAGKEMYWPVIGRRYLDLIADGGKARDRPIQDASTLFHLPRPRTQNLFKYLDAITDDTGLIQHSTRSVANRAEGYCVDDNARALLAISQHEMLGRRSPATKRLENVYVAFVQHSWNADNKRFRNFLSFDRRWLDDGGSEDSHGRTLHALASASLGLRDPSRRAWAGQLFHEAIGTVDAFSSPRAIAHAINALCLLMDKEPSGATNVRRLRSYGDFLHCLLRRKATPEWYWFEDVLAYENALLPAALINAARHLKDTSMLRDGIAALWWLSYAQKAEEGWFRPVGTGNFGAIRSLPSNYDQQPIEAYATIAAYAAADKVDPHGKWRDRTDQVYAWFTGANDLKAPLLDTSTFACCDGLNAYGTNANQGAESCLAAVMSAMICEAMAQAASGITTPIPAVQPIEGFASDYPRASVEAAAH